MSDLLRMHVFDALYYLQKQLTSITLTKITVLL